MLTEKDMEDAIVKDPERYLGETGLKLVSRQYRIGSYIFDLLYECRHGGRLIVELQRGTLDRVHTYKILDYYDEYKSRNPREFVDLMVVANQIPIERQQRLRDRGISFREIPLSEFPEPLAPQPNLTPTGLEPTKETRRPVKDSSTSGDSIRPAGDYVDFWKGVLDKCNKQSRLFQGVRPPKIRYMGRHVEGVELVFVVLQDEAWVELCIQKSPEESEAIMQDFERGKAEIEHLFGEPLKWERPPGRNRRKIMSRPIPSRVSERGQWDEFAVALVDLMHRFANALGGHGTLPKNLWT